MYINRHATVIIADDHGTHLYRGSGENVTPMTSLPPTSDAAVVSLLREHTSAFWPRHREGKVVMAIRAPDGDEWFVESKI